MKGDPLTGAKCGCKRGIERDNCPNCEGTGKAIDWRRFHTDKKTGFQSPQYLDWVLKQGLNRFNERLKQV